MPLYEYYCENCGIAFEALVSFKEADKQKCIACGSSKVERVNSTFASSTAGRSSSDFQGCYPSCSPGG